MAKFAIPKKVKESVSPPAVRAGSQTEITLRSAKSPVSTASDRSKIGLQDARRGIILSEILGKPLSRRRKLSRWY